MEEKETLQERVSDLEETLKEKNIAAIQKAYEVSGLEKRLADVAPRLQLSHEVSKPGLSLYTYNASQHVRMICMYAYLILLTNEQRYRKHLEYSSL